MGGISGLTEICFKTKNLELTLLKKIGQLFYTQPEMGEMNLVSYMTFMMLKQ